MTGIIKRATDLRKRLWWQASSTELPERRWREREGFAPESLQASAPSQSLQQLFGYSFRLVLRVACTGSFCSGAVTLC